MDLAIRKIELIDWLKNQDKNIIDQIDEIRKSELRKNYAGRMSENLNVKLKRSDLDIKKAKTKSQEEVETLFKNRK